MSNSPIIYWFRNDLRLNDNTAFLKAVETARPIIPVFIIDDLWYDSINSSGFSRTGQKRKQFLAESLLDLKKSLNRLGNTLHIFKGDTVSVINELRKIIRAEKIMAQREFTWEEIEIEKKISAHGSLDLIWGSMLYQPDQIDFPTEKSPFYFTRFKNKVTEQPFIPSPLPTVKNIPAPADLVWPETLPFFNPGQFIQQRKETLFEGGESKGRKRMNEYITAGGPLHYSETRNNLEGENFSSKLGPWLANGSLSPRMFFAELMILKENNPEKAENINPLIQQLIWRDYFRYLFLRYGKKLFTVKGLRKTEPGMHNDLETFERWRKGKTGEPLIDSLMHELEETGFMSNRGRMLVSSYLCKDLKVNWQWGAAWFESALTDYDVCSNYGNWAYQSGRGTDSRVNRRFNLKTQAKKFDPKGEYVSKWL